MFSEVMIWKAVDHHSVVRSVISRYAFDDGQALANAAPFKTFMEHYAPSMNFHEISYDTVS